MVISKGLTYNQLYRMISEKRLRTVIGINRSGHNLPAKFKSRVFPPTPGSNGEAKIVSPKTLAINPLPGYGSAYLTELALDTATKSELIDDIKNTELHLKDLKDKVALLDELGIEEYDDKVLKVMHALEKVKESKSKDKLKAAKDFIEIIERED